MTRYASALETVQIKEEVAHGTLLGADTRVPGLKMNIAGGGDPSEEDMGSGLLYATDSSNGIEESGGSYEMPLDYISTKYVANSVFKKVTPTGTATKTNVWAPAVGSADVYSSYSVEKGQTGAVEKFPFVVFNSMNFTIKKKGQKPLFTGDVMGQEGDQATALTALATTVPSRRIPATAFNFYSCATFGATPILLTTGWQVEFNYGPRYGPGYFIGSAEPSHDDIGIIVPANSVKVTVPFDVSGTDYAGLFTKAKKRAGTPIYLRLMATGATIDTGVVETWQMDLSLKIRNLPTPTDIDPWVGRTWELGLWIDETAQKVLELTTIASQ
jgi:hypothetical protein